MISHTCTNVFSRHVVLKASVRCRFYSYKRLDSELREMFDRSEAWKDFSAKSKGGLNPTGIFGNKNLDSPRGIRNFTENSLETAKQLTASIISGGDLKNVVKHFDILSDLICKVIDMVAFVRMAHPDPGFIAEAQRSHEVMYDFMNSLNTSVELYEVLDRVFQDKNILNSLSEEEKVVGNLLLRDFKKSGVNLEPNKREEFVKLSNQISVNGQRFFNASSPAVSYVTMTDGELAGIDPRLISKLKRVPFSGLKMPTTGPIAEIALRTLHQESARKKIWLAQRSASNEEIDYLKSFTQDRAKLASMLGYKSFAEYELQDKMAKNPQNVRKFLAGIQQETKPKALEEINNLWKIKKSEEFHTGNETQKFQAWDRDYFLAKYLLNKRAKTSELDHLSSYFSIGTIMQGLSCLFDTLYGIRFVPVEVAPGEVWHEDVRRLDIVSDEEGRIGVMYCDLMQRQGKSPHPAHFTVQCSREVSPFEPYFEPSQTLVKLENGNYQQLPIIVLICDFARNAADEGACLLSFTEVQTLFHEMGHAMHSMVGRRKFHNVSGTRCAADFVELPSVMMEHFASDPRVLPLYARHYKTNKQLPAEALDNHLKFYSSLDNCETYHQYLLSELDQRFHSEIVNTKGFDPDSLHYDLERDMGLVPASRQSRWYAHFGHLFGYGATYYCYLFDRAIADKIWTQLFKQDPLSREAGEKFKKEVLAWGGGRDPWECVAKVLDDEKLQAGDEAAMLEIGKAIS